MKKAQTRSKSNKDTSTKRISQPTKVSPKKEYEGQAFDMLFHVWLGQHAGWLSPSSFIKAYCDWFSYILISPAKRHDLQSNAFKKIALFSQYLSTSSTNHACESCVPLDAKDHRFQNELWGQPPFNLYSQSFLLKEQWWDEATSQIRGVSKHHQNLVNFTTRQILDIFSPSNLPWMNPEVIQATVSQAGGNFINGLQNLAEDVSLYINKQPPVGSEAFKVGENIAITPGKVIYRNNLIELIQYEPTTPKVYAEPVLIVPAWIMKYYILDLSPNNSMVKYLVEQGHTVFMISWKNPDSDDRTLSMEDYINLGILEAINAINHIVPQQKIHSVGYCIGGTLLMLAAAYMAKKRDERLKSITLFATQIDFKDAGELLLFIDESQLTYLEDIMWEKGYLDGSQMAGTFSMLQSIDLVWSKMILDYQLGKRRPVNDLMAWDYDTTRLPYSMHSEYLRKLFLNNDLIEGHYSINGTILSLQDIEIPIFAVSTTKDHVAPWKSVYKIHFFTYTDVTFVLTNGGHNSGVVNEPGHPGRSYQLMQHKKGNQYISPELWQEKAAAYEGSWWPAWQQWLVEHSGEKGLPSPMGNPQKNYKILGDAPGTYVFQK